MGIKLKLLLFITHLLTASAVYGQVNIESSRLPQNSEDGIYITSELGYDVKRGNTDVTEIKSGLRADYIQGKHHLFLSSKYEYGESSSVDFKNSIYAHLRHTYMFLPNFGLEEFIQTQSRKFNELKLRQLFGLGSRFEVKGDLFVFAVGFGGMFEYEDLTTDDDDLWIIRSTNYVSLRHKLGDKNAPIQAYAISYYQPLISDVQDYRVLMDVGLEYSFLKIFIISNSFGGIYDTRPPIGVGKFDLSNGFKIKVIW